MAWSERGTASIFLILAANNIMCLHVALSFWRHVCFCRCCQHSEGSHHTTALHLLLEGAFPLFPCQLKATKVLGLNTVCLHYDHSVRLPICWHYCYFLTCTWNALDYQNPETKQNRISTFIWIDFHKAKMKHSVDDVKHTESAFLLIQQALGDATLICKRAVGSSNERRITNSSAQLNRLPEPLHSI